MNINMGTEKEYPLAEQSLEDDDLGVFLDEALISSKGSRTKTSAIYSQYEDWAKDDAMNAKSFVGELRRRYKVRRDGIKGNMVVGFTLKRALDYQVENSRIQRPKEISADFVSVSVHEEQPGAYHRKDTVGRLRVKVGAYEIETDEDFPADKLLNLLRGLGGETSC